LKPFAYPLSGTGCTAIVRCRDHLRYFGVALLWLAATVAPSHAAGWYVANTQPGEWIQYQHVSLSAGTYRFVARVAATAANSTVRLEVDGIAVQTGVAVPNTGRADSFANIYLGSKALTQGYHDLRIVFETASVSIDWFMLSKDSDTFNGVKPSDITMVRPNTSGMLIAPVVGYEHKTVKPGVASSLCSIPETDPNGNAYTDAQMSAWYAVPMYRDYDRRTDRYWDILVDDLLASRAQVPLFHCRETRDFTHNLQDRDYQEGAGAYEGRWLGKFSEAMARNPQAASALRIGMFWENGGIADGFHDHYNSYPAWGDPAFADYVVQYWLGPWFDNVPASFLYQPLPARPIISVYSTRPENVVSDGRMGDFLAAVRGKLQQKYGYDPIFILPVGGDVDGAALAQAWGQAPWVTWDGALLETNSFASTIWATTMCGSRRRLDTVWYNDWNPATNTGTPYAGDANGHDSHQSHLDANNNSVLLASLAQAKSLGVALVQEEGFTNISEGNAIFRSYHPEWKYPNQHLAAMREYADPDTQTQMFEAEGCDTYYKISSAPNTGGSYRAEWYGANTLDVYRPLHNLQGWSQKTTGPGNLVQLDAGFFDVWALGSDGKVWAQHVVGTPDSWHSVSAPSGLTAISVGKGYAWALKGTTVYSTGTPYQWDFWGNTGWTQRGGSMTQLDVGETAVWGVNASGQVFRRALDGSGSWTQVAGTMDRISAGDNFIWGIRGTTISYSRTDNVAWTTVDNPFNITKLQVGSEEVWGLNAAGQLYRRSASGIGSWESVSTPGATLTNITVGEGYAWALAGGTPYNRRLEGFVGSATTPPMGLRAVAGDAQAALTWVAAPGAVSYNVKRASISGGPYTTIASTTDPTFADTGLINGATYYYAVSAINSSGNETQNSQEASAGPQNTTPAAPTSLNAVINGASQITLSWTDNSEAENGFQVERKTGSDGNYVQIAAVSANTTTFTDVLLPSGPDYFYRVRAYNVAGSSDYSNEAMCGTSANLLARTGWVARASVSNSSAPKSIDNDITTRWGTGSGQTPGQWFQLDMRSPRTIYQINLDSGSATDDYPQSYQVNVSNDGTNWGSPIATGAGSSNVTTIRFTPRTARYVRITQLGQSGLWWSIAEANIYGIGVPSAPMGVTATAGIGQVSLNWAVSSGASGYQVKRATTNGGPYTVVGSPTAASYQDNGVTNGTTYYYVVTAVNGSGESAASTQVTAIPNTALDAWRISNFGSTANASAALTADPDSDGRPNLVEYALGTSPTAANGASPGAMGFSPDGDHLTFSFHRIADPGLTYEVQGTDSPAGNWMTIWSSTGAQNTVGDVTVTDTTSIGSHSNRFLRLRISVSP